MADLRFARIWVPVFLPVTFSFLLLHLVLGLDVSVAPVWQVLLSHALGAAFALLFYAVSVHLFFPRWSGWRWIAAVVGALFLMAVLLLGWWQGGAYWGLRGPRLEDLSAIFALASSLVPLLLSFSLFLSSRWGRRGVSPA